MGETATNKRHSTIIHRTSRALGVASRGEVRFTNSIYGGVVPGTVKKRRSEKQTQRCSVIYGSAVGCTAMKGATGGKKNLCGQTVLFGIYSLVTEMGLVAGGKSKNIWHYCTIFRGIVQVHLPLSTKKCGVHQLVLFLYIF